mmetsp:Transcript_70136/g.126404  ORF Transcript_70136/g.126404 Transcript_70136/m.126404 type:complete len:208 (+) Transcript_70136:911-1534(+)
MASPPVVPSPSSSSSSSFISSRKFRSSFSCGVGRLRHRLAAPLQQALSYCRVSRCAYSASAALRAEASAVRPISVIFTMARCARRKASNCCCSSAAQVPNTSLPPPFSLLCFSLARTSWILPAASREASKPCAGSRAIPRSSSVSSTCSTTSGFPAFARERKAAAAAAAAGAAAAAARGSLEAAGVAGSFRGAGTNFSASLALAMAI